MVHFPIKQVRASNEKIFSPIQNEYDCIRCRFEVLMENLDAGFCSDQARVGYWERKLRDIRLALKHHNLFWDRHFTIGTTNDLADWCSRVDKARFAAEDSAIEAAWKLEYCQAKIASLAHLRAMNRSMGERQF